MKIHSVAISPILVFLCVTLSNILNLTVGAQPWEGEVLLSSIWVWTSLFLAGPFISCIAAWDGARLFPEAREVVWKGKKVRKPLIIRWWTIAATAGMAPLILTWAWMARYFPPVPGEIIVSGVIAVLCGLLTLVVILGWGLCLGSAFGKIYGPLMAFSVTLVIQLFSYLGESPILMLGGVSDSLLGLRLSFSGIVMMLSGLLCFLGVQVWFLLFRRWSCRPGSRAPVLFLGITMVPVLVSMAVDIARFETIEASRMDMTCVDLQSTGRFPGYGEVCLYLEHQRMGNELSRVWAEVSSAAIEAGVKSFPEHLVELPPASNYSDVPRGRAGEFATYTLNASQLDRVNGNVTHGWLIGAITTPTWCPGVWGDSPPGDEFLSNYHRARSALEGIVTQDLTPEQKDKAVAEFELAWVNLEKCIGAGGS